MKKSDIYEIAIKIFGLYLFVNSFYLIKEVVIYLSVFTFNHEIEYLNNQFLIISSVHLSLILLMALIFIFKSKPILKIICRHSDYSEAATLFANRKQIIEMALVIMGLYLIVATIPDFVNDLTNHITLVQTGRPEAPGQMNIFAVYLVKILLGALATIFRNLFRILL
ncbi:MAG: hypothetical protein R2852_07460 [Bacteroidia bacterium]